MAVIISIASGVIDGLLLNLVHGQAAVTVLFCKFLAHIVITLALSIPLLLDLNDRSSIYRHCDLVVWQSWLVQGTFLRYTRVMPRHYLVLGRVDRDSVHVL